MSLESETLERNVTLAVPKDAKDAMTKVADTRGIGGVKEAVPEFTKVSKFTTFEAEYSLIGNDIVVHFFMPPDYRVTEEYWKTTFAEVLEDVAPKHFQAKHPRLVAKYAEDDGAGGKLNSWWFKAQSYGHVLDVDAYLIPFFKKMDAGLDPAFKAQAQQRTQS